MSTLDKGFSADLDWKIGAVIRDFAGGKSFTEIDNQYGWREGETEAIYRFVINNIKVGSLKRFLRGEE